jgi:predicted DNA-binding transcriptional regulator YafY
VAAVVKRGFLEMRGLAITYRAAPGQATERLVEPQYLYFNAPVWYLLAWDALRDDLRTFRIDRIARA